MHHTRIFKMNFIDTFGREEFFQNYWEKKPLVIRNALEPEFFNISEDELWEMAQDDYFETRLIQESKKKKTVTHGPLQIKKENLTGPYTLFIHNLNLYNNSALALEHAVEAFPKYLFDDVMCSLSTMDSTVGAHIDPYNVFIVQAKGIREWSLQLEPDPTYKDDQDIKELKNFSSDQMFMLNPGDVLYIPPQVAHQGVTIEDSISLSIGFNSFESKDLIQNFLNSCLAEDYETDSHILLNSPADFSQDPYKVSEEVMADLKSPIMHLLQEETIENWILCYLTTPKKEIFPPESPLEFDDFIKETKQMKLCFDEFVRMSAREVEQKMIVAINGELSYLNQKQYEIFRELYKQKHQTFEYKPGVLDEFIFELYLKGCLFFVEDED
ncbi:MAG: hypothetical protein CME62_05035 [Halobacteriovoraceae bacterium]|nr:hypothetical protein [Halobacteriovoraceae bacterium]